MLKVYNTLTKRKVEFKPQKFQEVKMYSCGVTVYDHCHIGHGRSLFTFEVIRRYLRYKGFGVKFVRNITDVDDKIINKARQFSKEKKISICEAFNEVKQTYIDSYYEDLKSLNIPPADVEPLATENIPQMSEFIRNLIDKGFAYEREGSVYFSIRKFAHYGKLSGRKIDDLFSAVRIEPNISKKDPLDFVLWKRKKEDEPSWNSSFGEGRPGWHIECSSMALEFLGETLDIHGGGGDLIFPHHENEIAQSESLTGKPFSLYWLHHGLITIEREKMAKSLGNFVILKEILKNYHPESLKLFYLSGHYASALDFSPAKLSEYSRERERLYIVYDRIKDVEILPLKHERLIKLKDEFERAMDDNLNFSQAKSVLFSISSFLFSLGIGDSLLGEIKNLFFSIGSIFSLFENQSLPNQEFKNYIEEKILQRKNLREERKYLEADKIREEQLEKGIILEDLSDGTTIWRIRR
ncbi:MAG: cysteine--tRNA ligase [Candidatus Omnitrophica bacterium]|nr:cysteine--tRNA ligase [Candidatus Omnitrophota bacterium]MBU0896139.1 cysteine--tRNA ligase [Candidatus Omnitrophota bacterium]